MERGRQLGKYRLERLLGTGGMGAVWEAHDNDLDRKVALKVLRASLIGDDVAQVRLLREARAMARLRHPNVITVYDATTADGLDLVAMELIDGTTMAQWLATPRKSGAIVEALLAAGRGLAAAHAAGMIHRDFKPHNVLVEHTGRVLVTDFGLARATGDIVELAAHAEPPGDHPDALAETIAPTPPTPPAEVTASLPGKPTSGLDHTVQVTPRETPISQRTGDRSALDSPLTQTGALLGTPAYMAPEQFAGKAADARADQFAFCVSAWEALGGMRPFLGGTLIEIAEAHHSPPTASETIPRRLRAILMRGLSHDPAARWPTMSALLDALERAWHRPRRIASLGGVTVAFAGAIALFVSMRSSAAPPGVVAAACPAGKDVIGKVWSPALRAAVAQKLGSGSEPGVALVDRWAAMWSEIYDRNCARPDDPDYSARRACLEAQRDDVGSTFSMAMPANEAAHYVEVARILPSPESCQRAPRSIAPQRPTDPARRDAVIAIETELLALRVSALRGQHPDVGKLPELIARAQRVEFPPIYAEALYMKALLAHLGTPRGGPDRRRAILDAIDAYDAAANAAEAAGHDRIRVDSLLGELELSIGLPDRINRIDTTIDRARGALERLGDPANELVLDSLRAQVAAARGEWSAAIEFGHRAFAGWQARGGTDTVGKLALFEGTLHQQRHAASDLYAANELYTASAALALQPNTRAALAQAAGAFAWRTGDLATASKLIDDNALRGGGDPHGGAIAGKLTGLATGTLVDPIDDAARAARTSLPTIKIARLPVVEGVEPWELPIGETGAWTFEHVPPGRYTIAAVVDTGLGDRHTVRAVADVVAGERTVVPLDLAPHGMVAVSWTPRTAGVAVLIPKVDGPIGSSAELRARLARAPWSAVSDVSSGGQPIARDAWIGALSRGPDGPATACLVVEAELAGDAIAPRADDPPPLCKDVP